MHKNRFLIAFFVGCLFASFVLPCTTVGSVGRASADGTTIVAKNRDYYVNSGQILLKQLDMHHKKGDMVNMQFISIPQAEQTYAFIAFKSLDSRGKGLKIWRWGAGMGMNRFQVSVADNDANSWDRVKGKALHDNDITRLILERCRTAREAVDLVDFLITRYHSVQPEMYIVGDPKEVWIIETSGKHWAAKQVTDGVFARANRFEITYPDLPDNSGSFHQSLDDLINFARKNNRYREENSKFSFRLSYSKDYSSSTNINYNQTRYQRAMELLKKLQGHVTINNIAKILRDHYEGWKFKAPDGKTYNLSPGKANPHCNTNNPLLKGAPIRTICYNSTVGSMICVSDSKSPNWMGTMWVLFSTPGIGVYVPFFPGLNQQIPPEYKKASDHYEADSIWWQFESVKRNLFDRWDYDKKLIRKIKHTWAKVENKEVIKWDSLLLRVRYNTKNTKKYDKLKRKLLKMSKKYSRKAILHIQTIKTWFPTFINTHKPCKLK